MVSLRRFTLPCDSSIQLLKKAQRPVAPQKLSISVKVNAQTLKKRTADSCQLISENDSLLPGISFLCYFLTL